MVNRILPVFMNAFHSAMLAGAVLVAAGWILTLFRGRGDALDVQ